MVWYKETRLSSGCICIWRSGYINRFTTDSVSAAVVLRWVHSNKYILHSVQRGLYHLHILEYRDLGLGVLEEYILASLTDCAFFTSTWNNFIKSWRTGRESAWTWSVRVRRGVALSRRFTIIPFKSLVVGKSITLNKPCKVDHRFTHNNDNGIPYGSSKTDAAPSAPTSDVSISGTGRAQCDVSISGSAQYTMLMLHLLKSTIFLQRSRFNHRKTRELYLNPSNTQTTRKQVRVQQMLQFQSFKIS